MAGNTAPLSEERAPEPSRRGLLGWTAFIGGLIGMALVAPLVPFFTAPLLTRRGKAEWVPVGSADVLGKEERQAVEMSFERVDGWHRSRQTRRVVVGKEKGEWLVFSTECTHVGCGVTWSAEKRQFLCPCHGGVFNADGTVHTPPPTRPLPRLEARVNAKTNQLEVREA